jgi:hypothetical protein
VALILLFSSTSAASGPVCGQRADLLETPLPNEVLLLLAEEVSGQEAFDNMVRLAGAPWLRTPEELSGETNLFESEELYRMVRAYGIETVRLDRYDGPGSFTYPTEGDLWVDGHRLGRIPGDPALIAAGSQTGEVSGRLIYVPQIPENQVPMLQATTASAPERYRGAIALMWTHPRGDLFRVLDQAGVRAVISFSSRERYFDPDQVVYSRGSYDQGRNLRLGMTISWRQWSELLEDVERGEEILVEARSVMESFPNRFAPGSPVRSLACPGWFSRDISSRGTQNGEPTTTLGARPSNWRFCGLSTTSSNQEHSLNLAVLSTSFGRMSSTEPTSS